MDQRTDIYMADSAWLAVAAQCGMRRRLDRDRILTD